MIATLIAGQLDTVLAVQMVDGSDLYAIIRDYRHMLFDFLCEISHSRLPSATVTHRHEKYAIHMPCPATFPGVMAILNGTMPHTGGSHAKL